MRRLVLVAVLFATLLFGLSSLAFAQSPTPTASPVIAYQPPSTNNGPSTSNSSPDFLTSLTQFVLDCVGGLMLAATLLLGTVALYQALFHHVTNSNPGRRNHGIEKFKRLLTIFILFELFRICVSVPAVPVGNNRVSVAESFLLYIDCALSSSDISKC